MSIAMIIAASSSLKTTAAPPFRVASSEAQAVGTQAKETQAKETPDPLAQLEDFVASAAQSRKAFAEDRLNHLKEQMATLFLFTLSPGALAGQTARMARELATAASDFSGALKTLAGGAQSSSGGGTLADAYLGEGDAGPPAGFVLSEDDRETANRFIDAARTLHDAAGYAKSETAHGDDTDRSADRARESAIRVIETMGRLDGGTGFGTVFW